MVCRYGFGQHIITMCVGTYMSEKINQINNTSSCGRDGKPMLFMITKHAFEGDTKMMNYGN